MDSWDAVIGRHLRVELAQVDQWSRTYLDAGIESVLFCDGHLSTVFGVELTSGAQIVVKIRTDARSVARVRGGPPPALRARFPLP
jgi:hypothetical protein